jgi:hypothetical protein
MVDNDHLVSSFAARWSGQAELCVLVRITVRLLTHAAVSSRQVRTVITLT